MKKNSFLFLNSNHASPECRGRSFREAIDGNIGNQYISYSWLRILGISPGEAAMVTNIWTANSDCAHRTEDFDYIFLNLQDQLQEGVPDVAFDNALRLLKRYEKNPAPMVAFSLAANCHSGFSMSLATRLSPSCIRFFRYVSDRCGSIGVRGEFTASILDKLGIRNYKIVGCPSYFEQGRGRRVQSVDKRLDLTSVGLTGRLLFDPEAAIEFYMQGDEEWPVIDMISPDMVESDSRELVHLLRDPRGRQIARAGALGKAHFFRDFEAWKAHIARSCIAVGGTRLHGAIMALNAGVPAIVGNGDARAKEACAWFGIPWVPFLSEPGVATPRRIVDLADVAIINDLYDTRYEGFQGWLQALGLEPKVSEGGFVETPSSPKAGPEVVKLRLLDAYETLISETAVEHASGRWSAYTPDVSCGGTGLDDYVPAGRFRVLGGSCMINFRLQVTKVGGAINPLTLTLPSGLRAVAPTAMTGRETTQGGALQALVDGATVQIFDMENAFPAFDGASLTVSGCFETAPG